MSFFDSCGPDGYFALSDIQRMERGWTSTKTGEEHPSIIFMRDGTPVHVMRETIDMIVRNTQPLMPALPGYKLLTFSSAIGDDDPGPWVDRQTIVAWRLGEYHGLEPVLVGTNFNILSDEHGILEPDGTVQTRDCYYSSEKEWVAEQIADAEAGFAARQLQKKEKPSL